LLWWSTLWPIRTDLCRPQNSSHVCMWLHLSVLVQFHLSSSQRPSLTTSSELSLSLCPHTQPPHAIPSFTVWSETCSWSLSLWVSQLWVSLLLCCLFPPVRCQAASSMTFPTAPSIPEFSMRKGTEVSVEWRKDSEAQVDLPPSSDMLEWLPRDRKVVENWEMSQSLPW
jgi:hypothetical protein